MGSLWRRSPRVRDVRRRRTERILGAALVLAALSLGACSTPYIQPQLIPPAGFAGPAILPMPHPSWRNTAWLRKNPWFEAEVVPYLRERVRDILSQSCAQPRVAGDREV